MRAVVVERPGGLEALELREIPGLRPDGGQVLIETAYCGCNWADTQIRGGIYPHAITYPVTPGREVSGHILEVGPGVTGLAPGDRVAAIAATGGYAEQCLAETPLVTRLPDEVPLDLGAAFQVQALTAYHMLHTVFALAEGDTVLVHAAGGGVGLCVTQLAVQAGARVIGTVGTPGKEEKPLGYGAVAVVRRDEADFVAEVLRHTDGRGADLAIDSLGAATLDRTFDAVRVLGHVINIGEAEGVPYQNIRERLLPRSQTFTRLHLGHVMTRPDLWRRGIDQVLPALIDGRLEVPIVARFPLDRAREMHARLEGRGVSGKLLLSIKG